MAIISNATTIADAGAFSVGLGDQVLIKTLTASSSSTLNFVDGSASVVLDSTYPIYKFEFINIHPGNNDVDFTVNFRDGSTAYDATKTTLELPCTKDKVLLELAVKVLIRVIAPRLAENAPASAIVTALEIIATIKPPLD